MAGATGNALLSVEQRKHLFVGEAAEIGNHEVAQASAGFVVVSPTTFIPARRPDSIP